MLEYFGFYDTSPSRERAGDAVPPDGLVQARPSVQTQQTRPVEAAPSVVWQPDPTLRR